MGRMAKKGLEYFPMDIDIFQDIRIRKLIKYQGGASVTVYTLLLCLIYKDGYYMRWDKELPFIVSEFTGLDENHISEVIKSCLSIGLFDKALYDAEKILTSRSIQQRYCNIKRLNKRLARIDEYRLIDELPASAKKINATGEKRTTSTPIPKAKKEESASPTSAHSSKTLKEINADYLNHFFAEERTEALNVLCKNFGFKKPDFPALRRVAEAVIADWELSELPHTGFTDWSRHLISTMRIKISESKKRQDNSAATPPATSDYSFNGGFGGQDT